MKKLLLKLLFLYRKSQNRSCRRLQSCVRFTAKETLLVISRPDDYCFPKDLFYDTAYHLNAEGRSLRTARLLRDLRTELP
jgi:hypothetical protein